MIIKIISFESGTLQLSLQSLNDFNTLYTDIYAYTYTIWKGNLYQPNATADFLGR